MRFYFAIVSPKFDEWRKWKLIKRIAETEPYTNAIIGYKKYPCWQRYSLYLPPLFIKVELHGRHK